MPNILMKLQKSRSLTVFLILIVKSRPPFTDSFLLLIIKSRRLCTNILLSRRKKNQGLPALTFVRKEKNQDLPVLIFVRNFKNQALPALTFVGKQKIKPSLH